MAAANGASVAVIGAGGVGGTLARAWARAGRRVVAGVRNPDKPEARELAGVGIEIAAPANAIRQADVVVYAIPGGAMAETVATDAVALAGKIVIDATNNVGAPSMSSVGAVRGAAPTASVYRAFNSVGWENMADPIVGGERADMCFAGPDGDSRTVVDRLIADVGFGPVYVGDTDDAHRAVDALATLWFALAFGQGRGRRLAFRVLHEPT